MLSSQLFPTNGLRNIVWILGIPACLFGVVDRIKDTLADNYVSFSELFYFYITAFLLLSWLSLKPEPGERLSTTTKRLEAGKLNCKLYQNEAHLLATQTRMRELKDYHIISQFHVLPFPYLSQIYHLLNLKHLETVHRNSLGKLKVVDVCSFKPTPLGGSVKFRTMLTSRINILKTLRQPVVDVELVLHTPYMIELKIPVYEGKKIAVMFNVFPLSENSHELSIDIYSDLPYPKFFLRIVFHLASLLTLYEDLPYLRKLAERRLERLVSSAKVSSHQTMWLFKRFVSLHASNQPQAAFC